MACKTYAIFLDLFLKVLNIFLRFWPQDKLNQSFNSGSIMSCDDDNQANIKKIEPLKSLAVALNYDAETDSAPKVVASGRGYIAEQIIALAFEYGVKVREDADLAEILASVPIDSEIPIEAFVAVAEILSYIYKANNAGVKT